MAGKQALQRDPRPRARGRVSDPRGALDPRHARDAAHARREAAGDGLPRLPGSGLHTRFEHQIGSLHVAQKIIDAINLSFELDPAGLIGVSEEEARVIRIAALVHDITHIPFGHNLEDQDGIFERHDSTHRFRRMLAPDTEVGARLEELGVAQEVLAILTHGKRMAARGTIPPYWSQIVSGTICSDILDYLARDAYFTGLKLGKSIRASRATSRSTAPERQPLHRPLPSTISCARTS